jgi:hypothetical protein
MGSSLLSVFANLAVGGFHRRLKHPLLVAKAKQRQHVISTFQPCQRRGLTICELERIVGAGCLVFSVDVLT